METSILTAIDAEMRDRDRGLPLGDVVDLVGTDAEVVGELRIRQLELQMQNEELRRERDAAVAALAQAEEFIDAARDELEGFFSIGPELACIASVDGYFKKLNPAWEEILGYDGNYLLNRPFIDFVHPDDVPATLREVEKQLAGGATVNFLNRYRCKDGSYRWLDWKSTPAKNGRLLYATAKDITERKRATEALLKEAALNRALLDTVRAVVLIQNRDAGIMYFNGYAEELSGYSASQVLGNAVWDLLLPVEDREQVRSAWKEHYERRDLNYFENRWQTSSGDLRQLAWTSTVLEDQDGSPEYVIGIAFDITDRKLAEQEREQYFKFFEASSDLMCIADPLGCFKKINPACLQTLGYSEDELLSHPFLDFVHPDDRQTTACEMTRQLERGYSLNFENRYLCKDGSVRWLSWRAVYNCDAGVTYATARDITDIRQINVELSAAKEAADKANRAKTQFLSNVSHEIRTPMNGIVGMSTLLGYTELNGDQRGYLDAIQSSANTLLTLINELLDLSKIEAGRMELQRVKFSLRGCVAEVVKSQISLAQAKGLSLSTDIASGVPDHLQGDQLRLKQILLNLVGNAVKFTEAGSITVMATAAECSRGKAEFHFSVADTGIGIKREAFEWIFAPFSQSDASISRKYGGTGLGLSICTKLVALMNGRLWVESSEGVGSTFHVEIPFQVDQAPAPLQRETPPAPPLWDGPPLRILLVEDQEINRKYAMEILRRRGFLMEAAKDGMEAIGRWEQGGVDLILMDVQMPILDGIETTRTIRLREADAASRVPIIALTAHALREDRNKLLGLGFDGYVSKPIDINMLAAEIKQCLPQRFRLAVADQLP